MHPKLCYLDLKMSNPCPPSCVLFLMPVALLFFSGLQSLWQQSCLLSLLSAFLIWQIIEKGPIRDYMGRPLMTATNDSNPWWVVFKQAVTLAGGKLAKPEILASTTDARYIRHKGIPALGFSPMSNTAILLHDNNEV